MGFNHNSKIVECDSISFHAPERERENDEDMVGVEEPAKRERKGEGKLNNVKFFEGEQC